MSPAQSGRSDLWTMRLTSLRRGCSAAEELSHKRDRGYRRYLTRRIPKLNATAKVTLWKNCRWLGCTAGSRKSGNQGKHAAAAPTASEVPSTGRSSLR